MSDFTRILLIPLYRAGGVGLAKTHGLTLFVEFGTFCMRERAVFERALHAVVDHKPEYVRGHLMGCRVSLGEHTWVKLRERQRPAAYLLTEQNT